MLGRNCRLDASEGTTSMSFAALYFYNIWSRCGSAGASEYIHGTGAVLYISDGKVPKDSTIALAGLH